VSTQNPQHHESNRAFYDRISSAYDLLADANEKTSREAGLRLLVPRPGERALEVGCGTGNDLPALAHPVGSQGSVTGLDISEGMLAVARRKIADANLPCPVDLRHGDARQLPFADAAFDLVYSSFTLELFPPEDVPVVLGEIRRVLRAGGRLGVVSMAQVPPGENPSLLERAYVWMHRHFPHWVDCRPIDLPAVLSAAGFQITGKQELSIWTMPVCAAVAVPV